MNPKSVHVAVSEHPATQARPYPDLPADCDEHGELRQAKLLCRTFSDCTTAPRSGIISGCYPLDDHYKDAPEADRLKDAKKALRERLKTLNAGAK